VPLLAQPIERVAGRDLIDEELRCRATHVAAAARPVAVHGWFRRRPYSGTRRVRTPRPLEPERAERFTGELHETVARHPPREDLVPENAVVRGQREVVGGRGPEALDRDRKRREHPSLCDVSLEHPTLERALGR